MDWPHNIRVALKDDDMHLLVPGELSTPFKRSGYEVREYMPQHDPQDREKGAPRRDLPLKEGASCGACGGPVDALGCVVKCAESEKYRLGPFWGDPNGSDSVEHRLQAIKGIAELELRGVRPEFISPALIRIYEIANVPLPDPQEGAGKGTVSLKDLRKYCEERISEADETRRDAFSLSSDATWHGADGACAALNGVLGHFGLLDAGDGGDRG